MTEFSRLSRFGMTFKPLTESLGQDVLMSYLEDFPVRTFLLLDVALASKEPDRECGVTWQELLAKYDLDTSMWKTPQCSLLEDSEPSLETWPRWGLMQDGVSYQRQTLVPHTKETGFGSWLMPTPTTNPEAPNHGSNSNGPHNLKEVALTGWKPGMTWPTPRSCSAMAATITPESAWAENRRPNLETVVGRMLWPTPTAHNAKETNAPSELQRNTPTLAAQAGGTLNPTWVEWLMGWPLGWTDLKPLEMDKYQQWLQQHGGC
jgi:hypothetical protein